MSDRHPSAIGGPIRTAAGPHWRSGRAAAQRAAGGLLVYLAATAVGCGGGQGDSAVHVVERDSAGIHIVENAVDTAGVRAGWSIDAEPLLTIGGPDADESHEFYHVRGGVRLDDGRIVVANESSAEIRVYSPTGQLIRTFGRPGEGPGEYQRPAIVGRGAGDSLVVFDMGLRRATWITADEGALRSFQAGADAGGFPLALGLFADENLAIGGGTSFTTEGGLPSGFVRASAKYAILGPDGAVRVDLGDFPALEFWAEPRGDTYQPHLIPFGKITVSMPGSDRLWIGTADRWEVQAFAEDGRLDRIARIDREVQASTAAMLDAWVEKRIENIEDLNERRRRQADLLALPVPERLPAYDALYVDRMDNVWIGEQGLPRDSVQTWTILDREGRAIGRVTTPPHSVPLDIGRDYILAVTRDESDIETLTLWRLVRPQL